MIIACRECKTRFVVAPAAIGKEGRLVKCSKCFHTWFQEPPPEAAEVVPEKVIEETPPDDTKTPQSPGTENSEEEDVRLSDEPLRKNVPALINKSKTGLIIGWGLLAILLVGLGVSVLFFRDTLEDNIPLAQTLFGKWDQFQEGPVRVENEVLPAREVLVPHPAANLTMRQSLEVRYDDNTPGLVILLDIQNNGSRDVELPEMFGVIRDENGGEVFTWSQRLAPSIIPANGFQQYEIFVNSIQTTSRSVEITFDWPDEN